MSQFVRENKGYIISMFAGYALARCMYYSNVEPFIVNMNDNERKSVVLSENDVATLVKIAFNVNAKLTKTNLSQALHVYKEAALSQGVFTNGEQASVNFIFPTDADIIDHDKKGVSKYYNTNPANENNFKKIIDKIKAEKDTDTDTTVEDQIKIYLFKRKKSPDELKELARLIGFLAKYYPNLINDITAYWKKASSLTNDFSVDDVGGQS